MYMSVCVRVTRGRCERHLIEDANLPMVHAGHACWSAAVLTSNRLHALIPGTIFLGADPAHPEAQTLMHISPGSASPTTLLPPEVAVTRPSRVITKEEELLRECVTPIMLWTLPVCRLCLSGVFVVSARYTLSVV